MIRRYETAATAVPGAVRVRLTGRSAHEIVVQVAGWFDTEHWDELQQAISDDRSGQMLEDEDGNHTIDPFHRLESLLFDSGVEIDLEVGDADSDSDAAWLSDQISHTSRRRGGNVVWLPQRGKQAMS